MQKKLIRYRDLRKLDPADLSARDKILRTAMILFNQNGIHTTGIDRIIEEADIAKMTFYKHFVSKEVLINEYLKESDTARFWNLNRFTANISDDPLKQLLAIFDYLEDWFNDPDFKGCPFSRGLSDYGTQKDSQNYKLIQMHFSSWTKFVEERLLKILKPVQIKTVMPQLLSLILGSTTLALAGASPKVAQINKKLAEKILTDPR